MSHEIEGIPVEVSSSPGGIVLRFRVLPAGERVSPDGKPGQYVELPLSMIRGLAALAERAALGAISVEEDQRCDAAAEKILSEALPPLEGAIRRVEGALADVLRESKAAARRIVDEGYKLAHDAARGREP